MTRFAVAALMLGLVGLVLGSCSRESRYDFLTVFFTGVPPYEEWAGIAEPKDGGPAARPKTSPRVTALQKYEEQQRQQLLRQIASLGWTHGPYSAQQCNHCHSLQGSLSFRAGPTRGTTTSPLGAVGTGRLIVPVTELCIGCHTAQTQVAADERGLRLHGPVAAGFCVACHSPHQSRRQFMLLDKDNVAMCTQCHESAGLRARTPAHAREPKTDCIECHNPHMGRTAMILKSDYDEWEAY